MFLLNLNPCVNNTILKKISSKASLYRYFLRYFIAAFFAFSSLQALAAVDVLISTFTDNPDPAPRGGVINYTIVASNNGSDPASNVTVTIPLPLTTTYEGATMSGGTCPAAGTVTAGNNIVCTLTGNLAGGADSNISLNIGTTATTANTISPSATAATSSPESNSGNNNATQNTTINNGADLRLDTVIGSPNPVNGGGNITWAIAGSNQGPDNTANSSVSVTLPAALAFVSGGGGGFNNCSAAGQVVTCNGPGLANGANFSGLNLVTKVIDASSGNVVITPRISSSIADPNPNNNSLSESVNISPGADLQITQNTPSPSPGISGQAVNFNAQATNLGPSIATNGVTVTYQLPADFTFVSATPSGAGWNACTVSGANLVTCVNPGSYVPGRTDSIAIVATAPVVTNVTPFNNIVATIAHNGGNPPDPVTSNNTAAVNLNVSPDGAGLTLNKTRSPNPVAEGQNITSTLRVVNQGPSNAAANTITVTDIFTTADETFVSNSGNWTCLAPVVAATTTVSCTYNAALNNGATTTPLSIITKSVVKGFAYTATNNAGVSCGGGSTCWFPNGTVTSANASVTQANNSVDLALTKAVSTAGGTNATLEFNESVMTYTLVLTNNTVGVGAENIVIRDPIPGYRSDTPIPGSAPGSAALITINAAGSSATFSCAMDGAQTSVLVCTQTGGLLLDGQSITFTIPISRNLNAGSFTNTATVSSTTQGDTNTANNAASVAVVIQPIADVQMVSKDLTPSTAQAGTEVKYVLTFKNNGPSQAANVSVSDTFTVSASDPGFTVISITPANWTSGAPVCSGLTPGDSYGAGTTTTLTCTGTTLNDDEVHTIELVVRPNWKSGQSAGMDWTIPNTASITTTTKENVNDTDGGNNALTRVLTVQAAAVDLLINNNDNVDPLGYDATSSGNNTQNDVIYTINVVNNGPSLATGVRFTYAITPPSGKTIRFLGDSATQGPPAGSICNNIGSEVTGPNTLTIMCTYTGSQSTLASGGSRNRYLSVRLLTTPAVGGDIHNSIATVLANETDTNSTNNTESEATTVRRQSELVSLSGTVFVDNNNNGVLNSGEPGIGGVTLMLTGNTADGVPICSAVANCNAVTLASGAWSFPALPPSDASGYTVIQTQPLGYTDGGDQAGSQSEFPAHVNDRFRVDLSIAGTNATGYNFGEITTAANSARLGGRVWVDLNHNRQFDGSDVTTLGSITSVGWTVDLVNGNGVLVASQVTNSSGQYQFEGIPPGTGYQVLFKHPQTDTLFGRAVPNETGQPYASGVESTLGNPAGADTSRGLLTGLTLDAGDDIVQQSLPLDPSGVVYDALTRALVPGAKVTLLGPGGAPVPAANLLSGQSTVTTGNDGLYQFVLIGAFPAGDYTLTIVPPANYVQGPSAIIPPCAATLAVGAVPDPALIQDSIAPPTLAEPIHNPATCSLAAGNLTTTQYFFRFNLTPGVSSDVLNNNIPIDPVLAGAISVTKITPLLNVVRGDLVPYTITVRSSQTVLGINIVDRLPPGFKYRTGSGTRDGVNVEPLLTGRDLTFPAQNFSAGQVSIYKLILVVGTGVGEGEYINQAWALNSLAGTLVSNVANASVRITPDPTFDCSDIIGKVFDDRNANGYQDEGEPGIPNVRVVTVRGLLITSDAEGRFHVTCADVPDSDHGANFVMKLDERTLPSGYRMTTENPRDVRVTRGKMVKLNFGATVHKVIRLDLNPSAFTDGSPDLLNEWQQALPKLRERLAERPSILRLAYDPGGGDKKLAQRRLDAVADAMRKLWKQADKENKEPAYPLVIEKALEGQP